MGLLAVDVYRRQGCGKVDDYTVKIILSQPNATIMTSLAMFTASIVSPAACENMVLISLRTRWNWAFNLSNG